MSVPAAAVGLLLGTSPRKGSMRRQGYVDDGVFDVELFVSETAFVDGGGSKIAVSAWQDA